MSNRVDEFVNEIVEAETVRLREMYETLRECCDSPIEELLVCALYAESQIGPEKFHFLLAKGREPTNPPAFDEAAFVYLQAPIGKYRVDIAIVDASLPMSEAKPRLMVVECDGHDFHERTKEQARHDKRRDRYFQSLGIKVLRFTGSEIWASPEDCATEIIDGLARYDNWRSDHR